MVACSDQHRVCDKCTKCSLLDVETFSSLLNSKDNDEVLVVHINARSLLKNVDNIQEFLDTLDKLPDIICISETKIKNQTETSPKSIFDFDEIQLDGYHPFIYNNTAAHFGGTGIYVHENFSFQARRDLDINIPGECEASFIELNFSRSHSTNSLIVCSMYRHPHNNYDEFYDSFSETISKINDKTPVIIAGDMNINVSSQDAVSLQYKNFILSSGLRNLVTNQYTRIAEQSETTIDHILTNLPNICDAGVIQWEVADHLSIFVKVNIASKYIHEQQQKLNVPVFKRFFSESKKEVFCKTFVKNLTDSNFSFSSTNINESNQSLEKLTNVIQETYNEVFPLKK